MRTEAPHSTRDVVAFFALAFALTWALLAPALLVPGAVEHPLFFAAFVLGAFMPSVAGVLVAWRSSGRAGARRLLARVTRWRVPARWYAAALLVPALVKLVALGVLVLLGRPLPAFDHLPAWPLVIALMIVAGLIPGAIGEELGWRGFALPRLQARFGAFTASVVLGVVWAVWHVPTFFVPFVAQSDMNPVWFVVEVTGMSVVYAWIFNGSRGSVLLAILTHTSTNAMTPVLYPAVADAGYLPAFSAVSALVAWAIALTIVLVHGPRDLAPVPRERAE